MHFGSGQGSGVNLFIPCVQSGFCTVEVVDAMKPKLDVGAGFGDGIWTKYGCSWVVSGDVGKGYRLMIRKSRIYQHLLTEVNQVPAFVFGRIGIPYLFCSRSIALIVSTRAEEHIVLINFIVRIQLSRYDRHCEKPSP
jgi:hypothetical protein